MYALAFDLANRESDPSRRVFYSASEGASVPRPGGSTSVYLQQVYRDVPVHRSIRAIRISAAGDERVTGEAKSFREAQGMIEKRILMNRRQQARREFLDDLRKKTRVEIFLPQLPEDKDRSAGEGAG